MSLFMRFVIFGFILMDVTLGSGWPTCVILSCGMVSKFGEEKVNPLSVPASYGKSSSDTFSFHWSPSHRSTLSTPTNQSGLGTRRTINDSCRERGGSGAWGGRWSVEREKRGRELEIRILEEGKAMGWKENGKGLLFYVTIYDLVSCTWCIHSFNFYDNKGTTRND